MVFSFKNLTRNTGADLWLGVGLSLLASTCALSAAMGHRVLIEDRDASLLLWLVDQQIHHVAMLPHRVQTWGSAAAVNGTAMTSLRLYADFGTGSCFKNWGSSHHLPKLHLP